jgi:IPT/TIG domain
MRPLARSLPVVAALFAAVVALGCAATGSSNSNNNSGGNPNNPGTPASTSVSVSPTTANIRAGSTLQFTATVSGNSNTSVHWSVNGALGGSAALGTIASNGTYTAPSALPTPNTVTITATSAAAASSSASGVVTLMNPTPTLVGTNPASIGTGNFSLTITGTNFLAGSRVFLGAIELSTTFVSATQLNATGSAASAGNFSLTVVNPDPGSSSSNPLNLQVGGSQQASGCSQMQLGVGASLAGLLPFSASSAWNQDISAAAVDPNSANIINYIGSGIGLHADFGAGLYQGGKIGIPYTIANQQQPLLPITYTDSPGESDPGPMPIALSDPIEGEPNSGDQHVLVLDNANCFIYELYAATRGTNSWTAGSGAIWDLLGNEQRPYTWTSADAAGLPIFPGLVRYDEVAADHINHAIRFTLQRSRAAFIPPASHWAANSSDALAAPMGMRLRLKSSFNVSKFSVANQVILNAFKKYGLIMADNGSSMYIGGAPDDRWDNDDLRNLGGVHASDFEVIQMSPVYIQSNLPTGAAPQITSFTADRTSVATGTPVTLSWQVTGASLVVITPQVGAVRGSSVTLAPTATTTYTLYTINAFDKTRSTLTITVH